MKKIASPVSVLEDPVSTRLELVRGRLLIEISETQVALGVTRLEIRKLERHGPSLDPYDEVSYEDVMEDLQSRMQKQLHLLWRLRWGMAGNTVISRSYRLVPESLRLRFKHWMTYDDRTEQFWSPQKS